MMGNYSEWLDEGRNFIIKGPIAIKEIEKRKTLILFDGGNYEIEEIKGDLKDVKIYIGDEEINVRGNIVHLSEYIRNRIGITRFRIVKSGLDVKLNFDQAMILSEKIPKIYGRDPKDLNFEELLNLHNEFCNKLTDDITKRCLELPFSLKAPTGFEFVELDEPVSILFAYHYFRNNFERILSAYETILRIPHKELVEFSELVDFHEVTDLDEDVILDIVYNPERLIETSSGVVVIDGKSYSPTKVLQKKKFETFDTPENRFVKYFLSELILWCDRVLEEYKVKTKDKIREDKARAETDDIENLRDYLECFWNDPIFSDVGEMTVVPLSSQVLLKREGYRDVLELWLMFRSYVPFFGELARAIANKDIPKLYEYWCFFKLIEELGKILGRCKSLEVPVDPSAEIKDSKAYVEFESGWRLYYNKYFKGYSWIGLKPDFALYKGRELKGVFDAKFKLVVDMEGKEEFYKIDEKFSYRPTIRTWAKIEDIYKMHLYRDALEVDFAVILYPGNSSKFFRLRREIQENNILDYFKLDDLFNKNKNDIKLKGIGYLSFKPGLEGSV